MIDISLRLAFHIGYAHFPIMLDLDILPYSARYCSSSYSDRPPTYSTQPCSPSLISSTFTPSPALFLLRYLFRPCPYLYSARSCLASLHRAQSYPPSLLSSTLPSFPTQQDLAFLPYSATPCPYPFSARSSHPSLLSYTLSYLLSLLSLTLPKLPSLPTVLSLTLPSLPTQLDLAFLPDSTRPCLPSLLISNFPSSYPTQLNLSRLPCSA
jgi:hypothetical protein